jgi:hypothetical protein
MIRDNDAATVLFEDHVRALTATFYPTFAPKPVDRFTCRHPPSSLCNSTQDATRRNEDRSHSGALSKRYAGFWCQSGTVGQMQRSVWIASAAPRPQPWTTTIQGTPNRSFTIPNEDAKNVFINGMVTAPPLPSAANTCIAAASSAGDTDRENP